MALTSSSKKPTYYSKNVARKSKGTTKLTVASSEKPNGYSSAKSNEVDVMAKGNTVSEFISQAQRRFQQAAEAESDVRVQALDDLRFRTGNQWPEDIKITRSKDNRPCLEMDQIEQFIRQVCNEERQQRPSIQVNPVGSGADKETAEVEQGLIRHIEVQSQADAARDHAFEMMVTIGFGYYRVIVEEDELTGEQEIYIRWIENPFTVYRDPNTTKQDKSDARWYFIIEDLTKEDYKEKYPKSSLASAEDFTSIGDSAPGWVTQDCIRIAEYFYTEGFGKDRKVYWSKINAVECLEGGPDDEIEWQGKWIPIIPVLGINLRVENKVYQAGLVRKMKDPQRQYNYMNSAATEGIALAPKAPYVMAEGQNEGFEEMWRTANVRNWSTLYYKPTSVNGQAVPPPQRNTVEPPIQAMMEMVRQAKDDLQGAAGIYNPSLGAPSSDHSGKAILARQKQADITNLNWTDNLARSMWFEGRILLDLMPKIYTEPKVRRILDPDGTVRSVGIVSNQEVTDDSSLPAELEAIPEIYNIGVGTYDVTISQGASYQSKRQEAVASQLAFIQSFPQAAPIIGDLVVKNMDWPGADQISARLKKMLPPQLQEQNGTPEDQLQQLQSQNAQMQQVLQQQGMIIQQQHDIVQGKVLEQQTKKEVEFARIQADLAGKKLQYETQLAVAQINASKDANEAIADHELEQMGMAHEAAHDSAMAQLQHNQALELGAQQAAMNQTQEQPNG